MSRKIVESLGPCKWESERKKKKRKSHDSHEEWRVQTCKLERWVGQCGCLISSSPILMSSQLNSSKPRLILKCIWSMDGVLEVAVNTARKEHWGSWSNKNPLLSSLSHTYIQKVTLIHFIHPRSILLFLFNTHTSIPWNVWLFSLFSIFSVFRFPLMYSLKLIHTHTHTHTHTHKKNLTYIHTYTAQSSNNSCTLSHTIAIVMAVMAVFLLPFTLHSLARVMCYSKLQFTFTNAFTW